MEFFLFYYEIVCCVYSLGDSNEYTQHTIIVLEIKKTSLNNHHLLPDMAMIGPQWLEPPMSRITFHGLKDVRATEVLLYC